MQADRKRGEPRGHFVVQRAILALVLAGDPVARTAQELGREIEDQGAVEKAIEALETCGLLEVRGGVSRSLWPTRAARAAHRLEAW